MNPVWTELQLHYHEENKDGLILDLVRPLMQWLKPDLGRAFFVRHWIRGPHLRLRFLGDPVRFERDFRSRIDARVTAYLQTNPSVTVLNEARLLPMHQRLASSEMESGALTPFYPNNSWHFGDYDRRTHAMPETVADLIEDFYTETNELVFAMLEHIRAGRDRVNLSLDLMIATLQAVSPHIVSRFISYRSHAEVFIVGTEDDGATRERFERQYRLNAATLRTRLDQILEGIAQSEDRVPFLMAWTGMIERYTHLIRHRIDSGIIALEPYNADTPRSQAYADGEARLRKSPFHAMQLDDKANMEMRSRDPGFNTFRLVVNLQYLHLNRIGLKPFERSLLAYLIANTIEERFEVSAFALAQKYTYSQSQGSV
jgi:Lantibiotic biosynthesis dehydratase C-term